MAPAPIRVLTSTGPAGMRLPSSTPAGQLAIRRGTANPDGSFPVTVEALAPTSAQIVAGLGYTPGTGNGTVTSVALTLPSILSVTGSPVTGAGTLAVSLANQSANQVFAGPDTGAAAAPAFRSLVAADIPQIAHSALSGLTSGDNHTQYALLAGRSGGQTLIGDTASAGNLTLQSTSHATKGQLLLDTSYISNANQNSAVNYQLKINSTAVSGGQAGIEFRVGDVMMGRVRADSAGDLAFEGSAGKNVDFNYGISNPNVVFWSNTTGVLGFTGSTRNVTIGSDVDKSARLAVLSSATTQPTLLLQGAASQTSPLIELQQISSTSTARRAALVDAVWATATDASRKGRLVLSATDFNATREGIRVEASGTAALLGFFGAAAVAQQSAGTTATDAASTQALANALRTALINLGLAA